MLKVMSKKDILVKTADHKVFKILYITMTCNLSKYDNNKY